MTLTMVWTDEERVDLLPGEVWKRITGSAHITPAYIDFVYREKGEYLEGLRRRGITVSDPRKDEILLGFRVWLRDKYREALRAAGERRPV